MSKTPKNLNDKSKEYIENNFLESNPEGLGDTSTVPKEGEVVATRYVPEMKKVVFLNGRDPGYPLEFHYHSATHPLKQYKLFHGLEVTLPVEIIEHLESCAECQYGYRQGAGGHPEMYVKGHKYLYRCQPLKKAG